MALSQDTGTGCALGPPILPRLPSQRKQSCAQRIETVIAWEPLGRLVIRAAWFCVQVTGRWGGTYPEMSLKTQKDRY